MTAREAKAIVCGLRMAECDKAVLLSLPQKYLVAWVTMARLDKRGA